MNSPFQLTHKSATLLKAFQAAAKVEAITGAVLQGDRKALGRLSVEDLALLIQFVRDAATKQGKDDGTL